MTYLHAKSFNILLSVFNVNLCDKQEINLEFANQIQITKRI